MDIVKVLGVILAMPAILIGAFFMSFALGLLLAWPLMWAWNHVMPFMFNLHVLTYWQSFSLLLVSQLLIKNHSASSK